MHTRSLLVLAMVFIAGVFATKFFEVVNVGSVFMQQAVAQEAPPVPPTPELTVKEQIVKELAALRADVAAMNSEAAALEADVDSVTLEQVGVARIAVADVRTMIADARATKLPAIVKDFNAVIVEAFKQGKGDAVTKLLEKLAEDLRQLLPQ